MLRLRSHHGAGASESRFVAGREVVAAGWLEGVLIRAGGLVAVLAVV